MALKLISRKLKKFSNIILDNVYCAKQYHLDTQLNGMVVYGMYVKGIYEKNPSSKLYYLGDCQYTLLVDKNHYYTFSSSIDFK